MKVKFDGWTCERCGSWNDSVTEDIEVLYGRRKIIQYLYCDCGHPKRFEVVEDKPEGIGVG